MLAVIVAVLLVPIGAYAASRRWSPDPGPRRATALRCAILFAVGVAAAFPFLTDRAVGTGEAYNYSLAAADAVIQMRAGEIPPLVGQTEYAWNGRIHPLRNAPYLFYLIGGLDLLAFHRLSFWELQNLSLAFSLVSAVFACYGSLRWGTQCPRPTALFLAGAYALSPALLASAFTANLFMTVHAAVFVPIALGACFRQCRHPGPFADLVLAAALAAAWLAHPPVAFWLTASAGLVRGLVFLRYPTWRAAGGLAGAAVLGAALAGFVFASVATISSGLGYFARGVDFGAAVLPVLRSAFPGCLLPVSLRLRSMGVNDFQFGYAPWCLLLVVLASVCLPRFLTTKKPRARFAVLGALVAALLLLALTLPIPGLTRWLWNQTPVAAQSLTNVWPMQRVYLVALGLVLFSSALVLPRAPPVGKTARRLVFSAVALGAIWTAWEGSTMIRRGMAMRWTEDETIRSHLSSNMALTITAYAYFGAPPSFVHGVADPLFEFQMLEDGRRVIDSPLGAALASAPVVARGRVLIARRPPPTLEVEPIKVTLQPGRRYLLSFSFQTPPLSGILRLRGPSLSRQYILPVAGGPLGFGMAGENRHALSVWTSQDRPEEIEVSFLMSDWTGRPANIGEFAEYTLQAVDVGKLPIRLESLFPLRFTADAPTENCYVETPRRYLPGYSATVNGRRLEPLRSPDWNLMVPVPKGRSVVEIRYPGAGVVRAAFWVSAFSWLGFVIWVGGRYLGFDWQIALENRARRAGSWAVRHRIALLAAALAAVGAAAAAAFGADRIAYLDAVGPVRLTFYLPFRQYGRRFPLVATGRTGAGTTVFIEPIDGSHVIVGADVWGSRRESEPIAVDAFQPQVVVVDSSALYPLDHPRVAALDAAERDRMRANLRIELNGRIVLQIPGSAYESKVSDVVFGRNSIQSSLIDPVFPGEIVKEKRLPLSEVLVLRGEEPLQLRVRFPDGRFGLTEPLLALGPSGKDGYCAVTYLEGARLRFAILSSEGTTLDSIERPVDLAKSHELEFRLGPPVAGSPTPRIAWKLDGERLLGPSDPPPLARPESAAVGVAPEPVPGISARYTGPPLLVESQPPQVKQPAAVYGPIRIVAFLPQGRTGRREPLVVSGITGKGDFIYVIYTDKDHIQLGFDHWGVGGGLSGPIAVEYDRPHEFVVSLGSLYPEASDPAWAGIAPGDRRRLKSEMTVRLDGDPVYSAEFAAYPSAPADVTVGASRIGGSSCDPLFAGALYSVDRLGLTASLSP